MKSIQLSKLSVRPVLLGAISLSLGVVGCGSQDGAATSAPEGSSSSVEIALTTVPPAAQCITITATNAGGVTVKNFTVTSGSTSTNLQLGTLLPNAYTILGAAYNAPCATAGGAANWVADPQAITVTSGITSTLNMTFRKNNPVTVNANFVGNVQSIASGPNTTYMITDSGLFQSTSYGTKLFTHPYHPAFDTSTVPGNAPTAVAALANGACAVRADATVWCWGQNVYGELGSGIPVGSSSGSAVQVPGISNVTQISAGYFHVCAIGSATSSVYCWGRNSSGELGNGTTTNSSVPVLAKNLSVAKSVACGMSSSYTVDYSGQVYAWGNNAYGQLGNNSTTSSNVPVLTTGESPVQMVGAGAYQACSLRVDGSVHCWGYNAYGQLGNGTTTSSPVPVTVSGLTARQLSTGTYAACAISTNGQTFCWGANYDGEIGDGTTMNRLVPTATALNGVTLTSLNSSGMGSSTCGIANTLDVYCWGYNYFGNLGDGTSNDAFYPVKLQLQ